MADGPFPDSMVADIAKFFETESTRPQGQLVYDDVFKVDTFFPLQRKSELRQMVSRASAIKPKVIMEIGADKGGGLYHWCKIPTVTHIIACEVRGTPYKELFEYNFPDIKFLWLEKSSYDLLTLMEVDRLLKPNKLELDILFIDGDKSAFYEDFCIYQPRVQNHGLIFLHDIRDPGPKEAFDRIKDLGFQYNVILDIKDSQEAMQRRKDGIQAENQYENWLRHWEGKSCSVGVVHPTF